MTEETATGQPTLMIEPAPMARPYAASWVDYLGDLVHRLPGPWFVYYLGACLLLFLTANAIKWFDGSQVMWAIEPLWAIRNGSSIYFLGLMVYLTGAARRAWASFAPALAASPGESAQLYYRLTHLPAWPTLLAGGIGLAVAACSILFESPPDDWSTSQLALAFDAFDYALTASVFATMLYYTIHQITTVRLIHTVAANIDLFDPDPLYAFAGPAVRTVVGYILILDPATAYINEYMSYEMSNPATLAFFAFTMLILVATFLMPLMGMHQRMDAEKDRLEAAAGHHLAITVERLHRAIDANDMSEMPDIQRAMDSLEIEHNALAKLRTWPWQPGTLGVLLSALLFPVIVWSVQRVLEYVANLP